MNRLSLNEYLVKTQKEKGVVPEDLRQLIEIVAGACSRISRAVARGALADVLGEAGSENIQGESQKKLDVIANDTLITANSTAGLLSGMASEEMDHPFAMPEGQPHGQYLLLFDPLDGSSNIDVNVSIGTIFSVLPVPVRDDPVVTEEDFLQSGRHQLAAGYALYGPSTLLVLTVGAGVVAFTLDTQSDQWLLTQESMMVPADTGEYAINASNARHWEGAVQRYHTELLAGATGPRGKDFNMRWVASMVADVHRVLSRGGVFLYPRDARDPKKPGKLRLLYEANPMSLLIEQAGGAATDGHRSILDIEPTSLHERVAVILGAKNEVDRVTSYHAV